MSSPLPPTPTRVFISYSHDSETHKNWVLTLATRLNANGVHVVLDQWDLTLGSDLPRFMESGLTDVDRVLSVCTKQYVDKANAAEGGAGYEKMILTAQVMRDLKSDRIIPLVRGEGSAIPVPTFLSSRVYIDFSDDLFYEARYAELVAEIHNHKIKPRPALGKNPFLSAPDIIVPVISFGPERYVSPGLSGIVTFDYSNNDHRYVVGAGDYAFETVWSRGGPSAIHVLNDSPSIRTVALATGINAIDEISDARLFDTSSRSRTPHLGEIVIWQNTAGYYLATKIEKLQARGDGSAQDEITFSYSIQANKSASFLL